ncbi:uncharacterized protein LOC116344032 [Contarinia nasturtii]|uniref:uncharacterized protein LOC116344032 n=1 Tax=Contarinia nasturtii TaxID=265458 RepID=UPI0012D487F9|nr:uncharacterized protein LOC116344032 [Contarinia nasturtii]
MYNFYGCFVALIVFEVFVIQCDAVRNNAKRARKLANDEVKLPYEVIGNILHKGGLKATKGAGRSKALIAGSKDAMSRIFEDRILVIDNWTTLNRSVETSERQEHKDGQFYFDFGSYARLVSLFETFGKHARRISINYRSMNATVRREINKNIINKYANYLTELKIYVYNDSGIWEEISNENGQIQFPNVEKFTYVCDTADSSRKSFNLNAIFPKLESFKLIGSIKDPNCLVNVTNLKELTLQTPSIPEHQFQDIFAKNKKISKLNFSPQKTETLQSIGKYLKNLQTLKINSAGDEFLTGGNRVQNLTSVTTFVVGIDETRLLTGGLSFKMPNLKRLIVRGEYIDQQLSDFINHFKNLDMVEIKPYDGIYDAVECIEKLTSVKEYISPFNCSQLAFLEPFFETFDRKKSHLNSLKLICIDNLKEGYSEAVMDYINDQLIALKKPTWTLSDEMEDETNINYLLIKRNL